MIVVITDQGKLEQSLLDLFEILTKDMYVPWVKCELFWYRCVSVNVVLHWY